MIPFPNSVPAGTRNSRTTLLYAASALLAVAASLAIAGCSRVEAKQAGGSPGPVPVDVVKVRVSDVPLAGNWVGLVDGFVTAQIQPQVTGYLVRQNYREGSPVTKGQVLFEIDPRPFQATVEQAEAQVKQARGQLAQAQAQAKLADINLGRDTPLMQAGIIPKAQYDNDRQQAAQTTASVAAAEAAVGSAEAALSTAKLNLGFTQVRSLVSGVAGQATTQVGNLVGQQSVLTTVSQLDPVKVYFSISDAEYLALTDRARKSGADLLSGRSGIPLTLMLADGTVWPHKGSVAFVDRQMNQQTGAIRIAASFPNPGNVLRPGQFARVTAATEVRKNALLVPQMAVQEMQGIEQVYVAGPDNRVHVVNVTLGPQAGKDWIITAGLNPDQRVITSNVQKLGEGAPVSPHEISAQAAIETSSPAGEK